MKRTLLLAWLIVVCFSSGYLLLRIHEGLKFRTDLMALLPREEQDPVLQRADDAVTKALSRRIIILIGHENRMLARAASLNIKQSLTLSGLVELSADNLDKDRFQQMGKLYFPYRYGLLTERDRQYLQDGKGQIIATRAVSQIYGLIGMADAKLLQNDPFLLLPSFFTSLPLPLSRLNIDDGMLSLQENGKTWIMVVGQVNADVFSFETQEKINTTYKEILRSQKEKYPGLEMLHLGAVFFAHEGAQKAMGESSIISIVSIICTIFLVIAVFRALNPLWLSLLVMGVGVIVALSMSLLIFGELHVGALLFGVSLIGVSVDYSFQYCSEIFANDSATPYERLQRVRPAITIGTLTTVIGYLTLFLAPFPGLHQITVFSVIGLISAWLTVILWLPALDRTAIPEHGKSLLAMAERMFAFWQHPRYRPVRLGLLIAALLIALAGYSQFHSDDDVRRMQSLSSELKIEQEEVQKRIGSTQSNQFFLIQAPDDETALQCEEQLAQQLYPQIAKGALAGFQSPSNYIPSAQRQRDNRRLVMEQLYLLLDKQIAMLHLPSKPVLPNNNAPILTLDHVKEIGPLSFLSFLLLEKSANETIHVVVLEDVKDIPSIRAIANTITGVRFIDPAGDFSRLLGKYRMRALALIVLSAVLMVPIIFWRYGYIGGFWVMFPPFLAVALTPALRTLTGDAFTFFDAFALVLVLSIGVDYAIFCAETSYVRKNVTLLAVALAAATALLSFGLLSLSSMLAVQHFGSTLLIGISLAFFTAPLARKAAKDKP